MQRTYYSSSGYVISTHAEHMHQLRQEAKERLKKRFSIQSIATRASKLKKKVVRVLNILFWSILGLYYGFVLLNALVS